MSNQDSSSKFSIGLALGIIGGALAAFFLTPTTGEENRKKAEEALQKIKKMTEEGTLDDKAREIFGEATVEGSRLIAESKKELVARIDALKGKLETFDKEKFTKLVNQTVAEVNSKVQAGTHHVEKLTSSLLAKWETEEKKTDKAKKVLKPKIKAEKMQDAV